jgi:hypothetical protein
MFDLECPLQRGYGCKTLRVSIAWLRFEIENPRNFACLPIQ